MRLLKDRNQNASSSEIISIAFDPIRKIIASSAFEEPVLIHRYPYMKLFKKIIHREKLPEMDQENALIYMKQTGKIDESQLDKLEAIENKELKIKGEILTATQVLFTSNGQSLIIGYSNGDLLIYNTRTWKKTKEFQLNAKIIATRFINSEESLLVNLANWDLIFINPTKWEISETKKVKTANLGEILVNDDRSNLFLIIDNKRIVILDYKKEEEIHRMKAHNSGINMMRLSPNQKILATCGNDSKISMFDVESGELISYLIGHTDEVHSFAFSQNGDFLVSSSEDYSIRLWDTATFKCVKVMQNIPAAFAMSSYPQHLILGNVEGEVMTFRMY
ncbi:MAG: hypothetical protein ACTSRK_15455 [Promethearchaeota archaeon]